MAEQSGWQDGELKVVVNHEEVGRRRRRPPDLGA